MVCGTNLEPHWKHNIANFGLSPGWQPNKVQRGPALVCFQEVSQLATEEVSIFRLTGPAGSLSSLVVRHLNSGSEVCVFLCTRGSDYACGHLCRSVFVSLLKMLLLKMLFFSPCILCFC